MTVISETRTRVAQPPQSSVDPMLAPDAEAVLSPVYLRGDRWLLLALAGCAVLALILAPYQQTWYAALVFGPTLLLVFGCLVKLLPGRLLTRVLAGLFMLCFALLHVWQMNGAVQMEFFAFTGLTILIVYRDWRVLWPGPLALLLIQVLLWLEGAANQSSSALGVRLGATGTFLDVGLLGLHTAVCSLWAESLRRQLLTEAVQRSELRRLALVAERTQNAVIITDSQGRAVWVNDGFTRMTGYTLDDMRGRRPGDVLTGPLTDLETVAELRDSIQAGQPFTGEILNYTREGRAYWKSLSITPIHDETGLRQGYISIETNIDERKQVEQELRDSHKFAMAAFEREKHATQQLAAALEELSSARQSAEEANAAKSEFLANMSHEIRTPMTAILGFTDMLLEPSLSEELRSEAIQTIRRNGAHLLDLINDILDLSKIEAGKITTERIACSPCQIIAELASLMRPRAESKGLEFVIDFDGPIPAQIQTDPFRLRQILLNLVSNAIKFTESGEVRLTTRLLNRRSLDREASGGVLEIGVRDSGIGMSPEQLSRVFRPFTQADASTTRRFGGTGLGLTISKHLAQLLDGELTAESQHGRGSTFSIRLPTGPLSHVELLENPLDACRQQQASVPAVDPETGLACRVLLAEDGVDNQRLISALLRRAGAEVAVVENGKEAVDQALAAVAAGRSFDLILMDMQMPVLDGYSATSLLRRKGYRGLIIALTAHAMSTDRDKCLNSGCDDYATKPIDRRALLSLLSEHLRRRDSQLITATL